MSTLISQEAPEQACSFLSLPDELIVSVLLCCAVQDVLRVESTCRYLRHVCSARSLWTTILESLPIEHTPNLPPSLSLSSIPTSAIRNAIVRAVAAHEEWECPSRAPKMRLIEVPLTEPTTDEARDERREAGHQDGENNGEGAVLPARRGDILVEPRLLPGRPEALVINRGKLEIWHITTKRRLWCVPTVSGDFNCFAFDFEVVDEGKKVIIASADAELGFSTLTPLRIFSYEFASDRGELLFECNMPPVFLFRMMLRGSHVLAPVSPTGAKTMLINWRTHRGALLQYVDASNNAYDTRATLLAGSTVIAVMHLPDTGFSSIALTIASIEPSMSEVPARISMSGSTEGVWPVVQIRPSTDPNVACLRLPVSGREMLHDARNGPFMLAHRVFQKPWSEGFGSESAPTEILLATFDSAVIGSNAVREEPLRLLSYHIRSSSSSSPDGRPRTASLTLVKSSCETAPQLPWNARSLANNGHMFSMGDSIRCFSLFSADGARPGQPTKHIFLPRDAVSPRDELVPMITSVEPWSGAIAIGMPNMLKVLRFGGGDGEGDELFPAESYTRPPESPAWFSMAQ